MRPAKYRKVFFGGLRTWRANLHRADLKPRYRLMQRGEDLALYIVDGDMGDEVRSTRSLSGGERFLVSLARALALSQMGGLAATLFIDEVCGSLDAGDLDIAMDALETLQAQGRTIGVISHVEAMKDRIPVQVRVTHCGAGASTIELAGRCRGRKDDHLPYRKVREVGFRPLTPSRFVRENATCDKNVFTFHMVNSCHASRPNEYYMRRCVRARGCAHVNTYFSIP